MVDKSQTLQNTAQYVLKPLLGEERKAFLKTHDVQISKILCTAFHSEAPEILTGKSYDMCFLDNVFSDTMFVCVIPEDDEQIKEPREKVIGICSCNAAKFYTPDAVSNEITPYNNFRYCDISHNQVKMHHQSSLSILDRATQEIFTMQAMDIPVDIQNLCKDQDYKEVGSFMLRGIADHYKALGYEALYLSAESSRHRNLMTQSTVKLIYQQVGEPQKKLPTENSIQDRIQSHTQDHTQDHREEGIERRKETLDRSLSEANDAAVSYQLDQITLCDYYEQMGFRSVPNVFDISRLIAFNDHTSLMIFFKAYKLDL